jgi:F-box/WD-40 domain protein 7
MITFRRQLQADHWRVVTASDDKTVKVWDLRTGERLHTLKTHSDGVTCVQFSDTKLVSGSFDKTIKLLDFAAC